MKSSAFLKEIKNGVPHDTERLTQSPEPTKLVRTQEARRRNGQLQSLPLPSPALEPVGELS